MLLALAIVLLYGLSGREPPPAPSPSAPPPGSPTASKRHEPVPSPTPVAPAVADPLAAFRAVSGKDPVSDSTALHRAEAAAYEIWQRKKRSLDPDLVRSLLASSDPTVRALGLYLAPFATTDLEKEVRTAAADRADRAADLVPDLPRLFALYRPQGSSGYVPLFDLAVRAGRPELVRAVAESSERPVGVRAQALRSLLGRKSSRTTALDLARSLLFGGKAPPELREALLDELDRHDPEERAILERVAREDPNRWVREEVRLLLR